MTFKFAVLAAALILAAPLAQAAENPAEVDAVVSAVTAANPDKAKLCGSGPAGIQGAVSTQVRALAQAGKIKGNPQAVGAEAGGKIGKSCSGG
ncbi:hypothetical protein [Ferrovibrio sp.]|uniref:hypothetical protein n=1 Tax=Ferrovibrio sp. TaxID=1917215 RepID=UPI0025C38193|nr:hypothetical protein [Ferrovibrio sp.]MBX3455917.1 hypothetical protein [Ferrovibrio sp.]